MLTNIIIFSASLALKYSSWAGESGLTKNDLKCTKLRCNSLSRYCTNDPTGKKAAEVYIIVFFINVKSVVTVRPGKKMSWSSGGSILTQIKKMRAAK